MQIDDIGDVSSFDTQPREKGLLTFYQEQWTVFPSNQTEKIPSSINLPNHEISKTVQIQKENYKISISLQEKSPKLPFLFAKNKQKNIQTKLTQIFLDKSQRQSNKSQDLNLTILNKIQIRKHKENRIENINENIVKRAPVKKRAKQRKILESVHIQKYPFEEHKGYQLSLNKFRKQIDSIRIKKGSPFKGFHRQNFSISVFKLDKENLSSISKQASKILGRKIINKYQKYSSQINVAKYAFPIITQKHISLKKDIQELKNSESEDNLQKNHHSSKFKTSLNSYVEQKKHSNTSY